MARTTFALIPFIDMMTILVVFLLRTYRGRRHPAEHQEHLDSAVAVRPQAERGGGGHGDQGFGVRGRSAGRHGERRGRQSRAGFRAAQGRVDGAERQDPAGAQQTDIAKREVTIMGDKSTPYSVLKKIMLTCSEAEYGKVSFAVVERERAAT
jgi:hypothetical protein